MSVNEINEIQTLKQMNFENSNFSKHILKVIFVKQKQ